MGSKEQYPRYIAKDEQRQVVPRDERCRGAVTMPGQGMDEPDQDSPAEKQRTIVETQRIEPENQHSARRDAGVGRWLIAEISLMPL